MSELANPRYETACRLRASGKTQIAAYREAFEVSEDANGSNASRFFRRLDIRARVDEIKHRRSILADLDDAWVLRQLKAIAKNGELLGNCIGQLIAKPHQDVQEVQGAMITLRCAPAVIQANELLGKWLGMWKDKAGLTDPTGSGPPVIEVHWKDSPQETPPEPDGPRLELTAARSQRGP
jgi:hypothetical protein